jgi:sulfur relay (sulfurtransferase) DsrF/TusC family protein
MMKVLQIIESAYRATTEEQDDTIVWLTHATKGAGGDFSVLLRGNAVNYAVPGQDASGLSFGAWKQKAPPRLAEDIGALIAKNVDVYVVQEDAEERGLGNAELVGGIRKVSRPALADLMNAHDQVWHW